LRRPDADSVIIFLSGNGVETIAPVNDPWYRSNVESKHIILVGGVKSTVLYRSDEAASPLGCTQQQQVCRGPSAESHSCGPLGSFNDAWQGAVRLFNIDENDLRKYNSTEQLIEAYAADEDASRFFWVLKTSLSYDSSIVSPIEKLGPLSLASQKSLQGNVQGPLPDDQWKHDVTSWWNISLAILQASFVDTSYGPNSPGIARLKTNATNPGQRSLCSNQVRMLS
jgi:hypothetical protein